MSSKNVESRRNFLKGSTTAAAGFALAGGLNLGLARSAHAQGNEEIKVALIGCGGRGTGAAANCLEADPSTKLIAVADAFEPNAKDTVNRLGKQFEGRVDVPAERIFVGLDAYQKAIDSGPDLVLIATPPGFRPTQYAAAIKAGKHVFMEKPCCVDAPGFRTLMEANKLADEKGLKVGVGLQRHHQPSYIETIKRIHDGAIGDLLSSRLLERRRHLEPQTRGLDDRNAVPGQQLVPLRLAQRRQHLRAAHPQPRRLQLGQERHPVEANGMGGCLRRYDGNNKGTGQIFDIHFVEFTYADGTKMYSQCRHMPNCLNSVSEAANGTKGTSNCSGRIDGENEWRFRGDGTNPYVQEHIDLIAAIRDGAQYNEGWYGATSSMTAVLGRMATYSGKVVKWDDAVAKGTSEFPETLTWDAKAPVEKDENGDYPIPMPGDFEAYPGQFG